jgi:hypothetical protein
MADSLICLFDLASGSSARCGQARHGKKRVGEGKLRAFTPGMKPLAEKDRRQKKRKGPFVERESCN